MYTIHRPSLHICFCRCSLNLIYLSCNSHHYYLKCKKATAKKKLINNFQWFEHHQLANQIHNRIKTFDEHKKNRNDISKARLACTLFVFAFLFIVSIWQISNKYLKQQVNH